MQHWSSWVITSLGYFKDVFFCIDFGVMDDIGMVRIREVFVDIHNHAVVWKSAKTVNKRLRIIHLTIII